MENGIVNYSEYNKVYYPRAENLAGFFSSLRHSNSVTGKSHKPEQGSGVSF